MKAIHPLTITFLLLFICFSAFGQDVNDILYLKNGSIIKGKIIERTDSTILIETCCGSAFAYKKHEIYNIGQEEKLQPLETIKNEGYLNYSSIGILLGSSSNEKQAPLSLLMEHNYRFNNYFAAGAMLGYELLNESTIPLAANIKLMLPLKEANLFLGISGGYSFSVENPEEAFYTSHTGGGLFNIEAGTIMPLSQNNAFFIAIGYRYNELHYEYEYWWTDPVERAYYYNRISIRFGLIIY